LDNSIFTAESAWGGGFYELAIEVGSRSDDRLHAAISALWSHPEIEGCHTDRAREPAEQLKLSPDCLVEGCHLLGVTRLPNGCRITCGTCLIREVEDGSDWLDFYLPLGSLCAAYPVGGFPFGTEADWPGPWRYEVEDWLASVGMRVAQSVSFNLGLIGFEVSGQAYAAELAVKGIPAERFIGYLWPTDGKVEYLQRTSA
jgi:hypothetical protein